MSETPAEQPGPADDLNEALVSFAACVGEALVDVCSYGLIIGEQYVPFNPDEGDCEDGEAEAMCSQAWVRVMDVDVANVTDGWEAGGCGGELRLQLEVGVIRCIEVPEEGEAPTATDMLVSAMQAMDDMKAMYCGAMSCDVWGDIAVGQWVPFGPLGGQHGGTWTFTVTPK